MIIILLLLLLHLQQVFITAFYLLWCCVPLGGARASCGRVKCSLISLSLLSWLGIQGGGTLVTTLVVNVAYWTRRMGRSGPLATRQSQGLFLLERQKFIHFKLLIVALNLYLTMFVASATALKLLIHIELLWNLLEASRLSMHNFLNIIVVYFREVLLTLQIVLNVYDGLLSSCA